MFFDNFERICHEQHTTPSGACLMAGLDKNRSSNWKKSGALPKQGELQRLADVLKCEVADFFRPETKRIHSTSQDALAAMAMRELEPGGDLDENERELLRIYRKCDNRQRALFMVSTYKFEEENLK